MTYTFAQLAVPAELYDFVVQKMLDANYGHVFEVGVRPEVGKDCGRIDMHGLALTRLPSLDTAEEKGFRAGVEAMRQLAGYVAIHACLSPPDGGSPTEDEREMCAEVARQIYASGMPLRPTTDGKNLSGDMSRVRNFSGGGHKNAADFTAPLGWEGEF